MKKVYGIILAVLLVFVVSCTKVEEGNYMEGTYFGYDSASKYTAVVYVGEDGKIKSVFVDAVYGKKQTDGSTVYTTKQILGDDYGMEAVSPIGKEWYEQVQSFTDKVVEEQSLDWVEFKYRITTEEGSYEFTDVKPEDQTEDKKVYTDSVAGVTMHVNESYNAIKNALDQAAK